MIEDFSNPRDMLARAHEFHQQEKLDDAERLYMQLLNRHPDQAGILYLLGTLHLQRGHSGMAITLLETALSYQELAEAYNNLGSAYKMENFDDQARAAYEKAKQLAPNDANIWNNLATLYVNSGQPNKCIEYCDQAIKLQQDHPNAHWNRGLANLELENWELGWEGYHWGFTSKDRMLRTYSRPGHDVPTWEGQEGGDTVIVYGEQGVGDEVMFSSCLPDLRERFKNVVFDCHPRLVPLWRRTWPDLEIHGTRKEKTINWLSGRYDYSVALGSLPRFFRKREADFPKHRGYLVPDPVRVEQLRRRLDQIKPNKPKIGIAWVGGKKKTRFDLRSIPLQMWSPILVCDANFVSIQYTDFSRGEALKHGLVHWQDVIDDMDEQSALISACDLVISVCQTVVHLAGALNQRCWCLVPAKPAWRYGLSKDYMVWYPNQVRLIRQRGLDWNPTILDTATDLIEWINEFNQRTNDEDKLCDLRGRHDGIHALSGDSTREGAGKTRTRGNRR